MAEKDYSATPLWKKLGFPKGCDVALIAPLGGFEKPIAPLPNGVTVSNRPAKNRDVIVFFATKLADVRRRRFDSPTAVSASTPGRALLEPPVAVVGGGAASPVMAGVAEFYPATRGARMSPTQASRSA